MLKSGDKVSSGCRLEEGARRLKSGRGVTPLEAVKVRAGMLMGPEKRGPQHSLLWPLGRGGGGGQMKAVCAQMETDVAHVMWAVAGMGTVVAGHTTVARKD